MRLITSCPQIVVGASRRWLGGALLVVLCAAEPAKAAPEVQSFFPPGGQRGQTVEVTAAGKFPQWPVHFWADRPGLAIRALEKSGTLAVQIAADTPPDVYWLRLFDDSGASAPQPFVVGTLPEQVEAEPNDALDKAQPVALHEAPSRASVVNGRLNKNGDVDVYQVSVEAGQTIVADIDANAILRSPVDAVLQVVSADGFVLAQNDDQHGIDPRIAVTIPASGTWYVRVFGFPAVANQSISLDGDDAYNYRLMVCTGPCVDYTLPLALAREGTQAIELHGWNLPPQLTRLNLSAPSATDQLLEWPGVAAVLRLPVVEHASLVALPQSAEASSVNLSVALPFTATGRIAAPRQHDVFTLGVKQGEIVVAKVESRSLGFDLDPVLELLDASGNQLARVDDVGESRDAELVHAVAADSDLQLAVSDLHNGTGPRFVYRLTAVRGRPDFALSLDTHQLIVAPGATMELPVNVERQHAFAEPITIAIENLPTGLHVEPAVSQAADDSAKRVILKVTADASAAKVSAPIRVTGRAGDQPARTAKITAGAHGVQPLDPWLTVSAAEAKP
ncbi:MAG: PPC domain-containing protein [Pirellulales bacterium]|nr:PPC domain-containing protein [Pirellulales bacterium]